MKSEYTAAVSHMYDIPIVLSGGVMQTKYERSVERRKNSYEGHSLITFLDKQESNNMCFRQNPSDQVKRKLNYLKRVLMDF